MDYLTGEAVLQSIENLNFWFAANKQNKF